MTAHQPPLFGQPDTIDLTDGWFYVCANDAGLLKCGISKTTTTLQQRFDSHKRTANMRPVFQLQHRNYREMEAHLKKQLAGFIVIGHEWFDISDVSAMAEVVDYLDRQGGNTWHLKVTITEIVRSHPRFHNVVVRLITRGASRMSRR